MVKPKLKSVQNLLSAEELWQNVIPMRAITIVSCTIAALSLVFSGCVSSGPTVVLSPVGPHVPLPYEPPKEGTLLVYSAFYAGPQQFLADPPEDVRQHTPYSIFAEDGHLLQTVKKNVSGPWSEDPATVQLPPGRYSIEARANGYRKVIVPVVIAVGLVTSIHLDGESSDTDIGAANSPDRVRLPNGVVVGWKAEGLNDPSASIH